MRPDRRNHTVPALLLIVLASFTTVVNAADNKTVANNGLLPVIPEALGERCVEDTNFMRRNHMDLLQHQRDETMLKGIRTKQHSLKACISCHVVTGDDMKPVTVASPKHFCRSCHDYAAVSVDCFQCHASRPDSELPSLSGTQQP